MSYLAWINDWLAVGACESCPTAGFDRVVHIYRDDTGEHQRRCCIYPDARLNLTLKYKDGDKLPDAFLLKMLSWSGVLRSRIEKKILIHCHAGMCRSPTVAMLLLSLVERMHPLQALAIITQAIYTQRNQLVCNIVYNPLKQIIRFCERELKLTSCNVGAGIISQEIKNHAEYSCD